MSLPLSLGINPRVSEYKTPNRKPWAMYLFVRLDLTVDHCIKVKLDLLLQKH